MPTAWLNWKAGPKFLCFFHSFFWVVPLLPITRSLVKTAGRCYKILVWTQTCGITNQNIHRQSTPTINIHINTHSQPVDGEREIKVGVRPMRALSASVAFLYHFYTFSLRPHARLKLCWPTEPLTELRLCQIHTHTHIHSDCWQQWVVRQQMVSLNETLMRDNWSGNAQTIIQPNS